jgi:hypothetical protein
MGRAGFCVNHPERPADRRCVQCHKALCNDCVLLDEGDTFCSRKCLSRYRTFHRAYVAEHARTPLVTTLIRIGAGVLILLILWVLIYITGDVLHVPVLKVISEFLGGKPFFLR